MAMAARAATVCPNKSEPALDETFDSLGRGISPPPVGPPFSWPQEQRARTEPGLRSSKDCKIVTIAGCTGSKDQARREEQATETHAGVHFQHQMNAET